MSDTPRYSRYFPARFNQEDVKIVRYEDALPSLVNAYLNHASILQPERDYKEEGQGPEGYVQWLDAQMKGLRSEGAKQPFGFYIMSWYSPFEKKEIYLGGFGVVRDDREVARNCKLSGDGFWAGTIVVPEVRKKRVPEIAILFRDALCQKFANDIGRTAKFYLISTSSAAAQRLMHIGGFVDTGVRPVVPVLGKVDLLFREFHPTPTPPTTIG